MLSDTNVTSPKLTICAVGSSGSTHVVSRVKCFAELGHQVYLICEQVMGLEGVIEIVPQALPTPALSRIIKVIETVSTRFFKKSIARYADTIYLLLNFIHILKQHQPDIVHVHFAYSIWGWMAAVANRHPLVVSVMGGDILFDEQGSPTPRGKWLTLQLLKRADLITSKSDYLTSVLERLGGFHTKTIKVVWGVDLHRFQRVDATELRTTLGFDAKHRVILSPKILQPFYNVHLIVEAMPRIIAVYPDARLLITEYGADPGYHAQIVDRVEQLGLREYVTFVGHVPHHDMPLYYSLADVTVAVPSSDGLPQTLLEGMVCEVPNILSRLPRYEEIVTHEDSAYFVDTSPEGIAHSVIHLFSDCALAERMVHNSLAIVCAQADFANEVSRVESAYHSLLARLPKRRRRLLRPRIFLEVLRYFYQR